VLAQTDDSAQSNIRARVYNDGAEPLEGVSIRYFLNLSELPHGFDDLGIEGAWCREGVLKGPAQYHNDIYYLELSFNEPVEPKTFVEDTWMMFDRDNWDDWDSSNDWSAQWKQTGQWYLDPHIPAYQNGNLIWGYEPSVRHAVTPFENISTPLIPTGEKHLIPSHGFVIACIAIIIALLIKIKNLNVKQIFREGVFWFGICVVLLFLLAHTISATSAAASQNPLRFSELEGRYTLIDIRDSPTANF